MFCLASICTGFWYTAIREVELPATEQVSKKPVDIEPPVPAKVIELKDLHAIWNSKFYQPVVKIAKRKVALKLPVKFSQLLGTGEDASAILTDSKGVEHLLKPGEQACGVTFLKVISESKIKVKFNETEVMLSINGGN